MSKRPYFGHAALAITTVLVIAACSSDPPTSPPTAFQSLTEATPTITLSRTRLSVPVGTLAVGIFDAKTRSIVWRAAATKDLDFGASPEKWEKNLNKAVEKMFKHYPPGS
jgi:hypothetical protein